MLCILLLGLNIKMCSGKCCPIPEENEEKERINRSVFDNLDKRVSKNGLKKTSRQTIERDVLGDCYFRRFVIKQMGAKRAKQKRSSCTISKKK